MEGRPTPPPGGGPERDVVRERAWEEPGPEQEALSERLTTTRRWAYVATLLAALAAIAAAVALAFALQDRADERRGASRSAVRALEAEVSRLQDQVRSARSAGSDAQETADSLSSRIEELEQDVAQARGPDQGTQEQLDRLTGDVEELRSEVEQLAQDGGSGGNR